MFHYLRRAIQRLSRKVKLGSTFLLLSMYLVINTQAQKNDYKQQETLLIKEYNAIYAGFDFYGISDTMIANAKGRYCKFRDHLVNVVSKQGALQYDFPLLQGKVNISTSADRKLRIMNWGVPAYMPYSENNTGHALQVIDAKDSMHFKWSDDLRLSENPYSDSLMNDDIGAPCSGSITSIEKFSFHSRTTYLIFSYTWCRGTGNEINETLEACQIKGDSLDWQLPVFYWDDSLDSRIDLDYENLGGFDDRVELDPKYDSRTQTISFYQADLGGPFTYDGSKKVARSIIKLKFDGQSFKPTNQKKEEY
jgi:hypothetical protein